VLKYEPADLGTVFPAGAEPTIGQGVNGWYPKAVIQNEPWTLRAGTRVGSLGGTPDVDNTCYLDGIAVGDAGFHYFQFFWSSSLLPADFFDKSRFHTSFRFRRVTLMIEPRLQPKPWPAGPVTTVFTVPTVPPATSVFPTGQVPGAIATSNNAPFAPPANACMSSFPTFTYIVPMKQSKLPPTVTGTVGLPGDTGNFVQNEIAQWITCGLSDTYQQVTPSELARRNAHAAKHHGSGALVCEKTVKVYKPSFASSMNNPMVQNTTMNEPVQYTLHEMPWQPIPAGGYYNTIAAGILNSGVQTTLRTPIPSYSTPMCGFLVDTSQWPTNTSTYLQSAVNATPPSYQNFAAVTDGIASTPQPQVLNPPIFWDCTYVVEVEFAGTQTSIQNTTWDNI